MNINYKNKYLKYKKKYLELKNKQKGSGKVFEQVFIEDCRISENKISKDSYNFYKSKYQLNDLDKKGTFFLEVEKINDKGDKNLNYICQKPNLIIDIDGLNGSIYEIWNQLNENKKEEILDKLMPVFINYILEEDPNIPNDIYNNDLYKDILEKVNIVIEEFYNFAIKYYTKKGLIINNEAETMILNTILKIILFYNLDSNNDLEKYIKYYIFYTKKDEYLSKNVLKYKEYNFKIYETGGAGHCFYYSFLTALRHINYDINILKKNCKEYFNSDINIVRELTQRTLNNQIDKLTNRDMRLFKEVLKLYIEPYVNLKKKYDINTNIIKLRNKLNQLIEGCVFAENEIIHMCTSLFSVRIIMYTDYDYLPEEQKISSIEDDLFNRNLKTICIYNTPGTHFQYLFPNNIGYQREIGLRNVQISNENINILMREKYYNFILETYK